MAYPRNWGWQRSALFFARTLQSEFARPWSLVSTFVTRCEPVLTAASRNDLKVLETRYRERGNAQDTGALGTRRARQRGSGQVPENRPTYRRGMRCQSLEARSRLSSLRGSMDSTSPAPRSRRKYLDFMRCRLRELRIHVPHCAIQRAAMGSAKAPHNYRFFGCDIKNCQCRYRTGSCSLRSTPVETGGRHGAITDHLSKWHSYKAWAENIRSNWEENK